VGEAVGLGLVPTTYSAVGYVPGPVSFSFTVTCRIRPTHTYITTTNYAYSGYIDVHGTLHHAPDLYTVKYTGDPYCQGGTGTNGLATTDDGSGYTISIPWNGSTATVTSKGGANLSVPIGGGMATWAEDANGNEITVNTSTGQFFDTLSSTSPVLTVTGTSPVNYTYAGPSGNVSVVVSYKTYPVQTHFQCSGVTDYGASSPINNNLVDKITYPDGSYYQFTYEPTTTGSGNVTGRIASVKLPTGGTISYAYTGSNGGIDCADGSTMGFNRTTPDSSTPWKYVRSGSNPNWTTTVTDPLNEVTTYNLYQLTSTTTSGSASLNTYTYYETNRTATGATVLTCYNGNYSNCASVAVSLPISQTDSYRTLGSKTSAVETKYDTTNGGRVTDIKEYDFGLSTGSAPPGTLLLRETTISYAGLSGIIDHPYQITVKDGSGHVKSQTTYAYDETGVTTTSGTPQHTSPPSGSRGNPTTITFLTSGTSTIKKTFTYFDTGNVNVATDVNGAQTTNHYGACGNSFPTEIDLPLSLIEYFTWDNNNTCVGAVMVTAKDVNQNTTTYGYTDPEWRLTSVTRPDGGSTTYTYTTGASYPWNIGAWTTTNSSTGFEHSVTYDGLGRQLWIWDTDPNNASDQHQTGFTYDALGRVSTVTNPYYTTSDPTYGVTTYSYDALGRITQRLDPAGYNTFYSYTGRAMSVQYYPSWFNKETIYQSDGLDRTVSICEVDAAGISLQGSPSQPTNCNLDIQGTGLNGFLTSYQYDVLNNITQVTHPNGAARAYQYDGLSRLTSATDPEVGTSSGYYAYTYSYDNQNAVGDLYQRTGPAPNQTAACPPTCVTTTYGHDALHRLTSIEYSDGSTPWSFFLYDQSQSNIFSLSNYKGRMTAALTCPSGVTCGSSSPPITNTIFSYDPVGRVAEDYQCTPSTCPGNSYFSFPYSYDYIGDVLTATDGKGINYTNQYNAIGQLSQISTNWLSPTQSGTIVSGIQYNPLGEPTSDQLGNLIAESWTYGADGNVASYSAGSAYSFSIPSIIGGTFVYSANDVLNGNWSYGYDNFGRLTSSSCSGSCPFSQSATAYTYNYDAEGNRWQQNLTQGTGDNSLHTFGAWNHISDGSVIYDSAGEITNDSSHTYSYDAEGRLLKVDAGNTAIYVYDAFGRRISQQNSSGTFEYLFDLQNHPITKLQSGNRVAGEVWFGRHWASNTGSAIIFMHSDWLGTGRVWTDLSGNSTQYCQGLPFGDGLYCWSTNYSDNFAGLTFNFDDFIYDSQTRQLNPYNGRWTVPDPAGLGAVDPTNPQTWNRYSYVENNPLTFTDPRGLARTLPWGPQGGGGFTGLYLATGGNSYNIWAITSTLNQLAAGFAYMPGAGVREDPDTGELEQIVGWQTRNVMQLGGSAQMQLVPVWGDYTPITGDVGDLQLLAQAQAPPGPRQLQQPAGPAATVHQSYQAWSACVSTGGMRVAGETAIKMLDETTNNGEAPSWTTNIAIVGESVQSLQADCLREFPLAGLDPEYQGPEPGDVFFEPPFPVNFLWPY
jgi:RHS repeat-associated protein